MNNMGMATIGRDMTSFDMAPQRPAYTKVIVEVDDETSYVANGSADDGQTLIVTNPWGTQQMADNILADLVGFRYQPYTANGALVSPAAELGDGLNMVGTEVLYSGIYQQNTEYNTLCSADLSAPSEDEINHEYPYTNATERKTSRSFTALSASVSALSIQASNISASVETKLDAANQTSAFSWRLDSEGFYINSSGNASAEAYVVKVDSNGASVEGAIKATSGYIGGENGWVITSGKIYKGTAGESSSIHLDTSGNTTATIADTSLSNLTIAVGANFGVTRAGTLYAKGAILSGSVEATSGSIGGFTINASSISSTNLTLNSGGSISGGSTYKWNISSAGVATFANVNITGGSFTNGTFSGSGSGSFSGSCSGSFSGSSASKFKVGGKALDAYVDELIANKVTANYINSKISDMTILYVKSVQVKSNFESLGTAFLQNTTLKSGYTLSIGGTLKIGGFAVKWVYSDSDGCYYLSR